MDTSKKSGNQFPVWFGIDVSKDSFTAACDSFDRREFRLDEGGFGMDSNGVRSFLRWRIISRVSLTRSHF